MVTVVGTLVLGFVLHILMFLVYKIRTNIYKKCITKSTIIPTTMLHTGSGISMVFGQENRGFNDGSIEKIPKNN